MIIMAKLRQSVKKI